MPQREGHESIMDWKGDVEAGILLCGRVMGEGVAYLPSHPKEQTNKKHADIRVYSSNGEEGMGLISGVIRVHPQPF